MSILVKIRDTVRLAIYKKRFDFKSSCDNSFRWSDIKSLVVCKFDGKLGDSQIISPFLKTLITKYPNLKITILCPSNIKDIYIKHYGIQNTITCSNRPDKREIFGIVQKIGFCDFLLTLEGKFRFHDFFLLHLLKPKYIAGINKSVNSINIDLSNKAQQSHISKCFEYLLKIGGVQNKDIFTEYTPIISPSAEEDIKKFLNGQIIALAPWGASKHRRLNDNVVIEISKLISSYKAKVLILTPPEGNYLSDLVSNKIGENFIVKIPNKISICELSAAIKFSKALISVDTANIHLACAVQRPIFGIYSGVKPYQWILWGPKPDMQHAEIFYSLGKKIDELTFIDIQTRINAFIKEIQK